MNSKPEPLTGIPGIFTAHIQGMGLFFFGGGGVFFPHKRSTKYAPESAD